MRRMRFDAMCKGALLLALAAATLAGAALPVPAAAEEWPGWRGPRQDGVSKETGLVSSWSPAGENLAFRAPLTGRSTPVVFDGRVCANGRAGEGVTRQEHVACFDAGTGEQLWERYLDVYHSTVPFNRVGWASPVGDPETGNLYVLGVGGLLVALDRKGETVWQRSLNEEVGFYSGYGGRTHTPMIDEDRLVLSFVNSSWGDQATNRNRTFAFDKRTGDILWVSTPGTGNPYDLNTSTTPVAAVVGGRRLLVEGNADGWVYAIEARTGKHVWGFQLTKGGINVTVAVHGDTVFAAHSEENVDTPGVMGRVVAIDATGSGDVTKTHERWRADELGAGFSSPVYHDGRLYVVDNSANLFALDAATGKELWRHKLGTVGKASPVVADGKIYVPELNGRFWILKPGATGAQVLDEDEVTMPDGRYAELYGSPAVAYGRVYFASENGLFALGPKGKVTAPAATSGSAGEHPPAEPPPAAGARPATLVVSPTEVIVAPGEALKLTARLYDDRGRPLGEAAAVEWSLAGLAGKVANGTFTPDPGAGLQVGRAVAKAAGLEGAARVRVIPPLPWSFDFESAAAGSSPPWWIGVGTKFVVAEKDGGKVLQKPPVKVGLDRSDVFMGPATLAGYTVQADVAGAQRGRRRPDIGLLNSGYTLDLMGAHQKLQVRAWSAELRLEKSVPFAWEPDAWYTMKLRVDQRGETALVRGKVWKRGEPEPAAWTIEAEDPRPVRQGSPGIYGYSAADLFYDNLKVTVNER